MKIFLNNWMPVKSLTNLRQIIVFSEWTLVNQDVILRATSNLNATNESVVEYDIVPGTTNGKIILKADILLNDPWNALPPSYNIVIKSFENNVMKDEEGILAEKAPSGL